MIALDRQIRLLRCWCFASVWLAGSCLFFAAPGSASADEPPSTSTATDSRDPWDDTVSFGAQVAATVNGEAILNRQVLSRCNENVHSYLEDLRRRHQGSFWELRNRYVQKELSGRIQEILLIQKLKATVAADLFEMMAAQAQEAFENEEVGKLIREMKVSSRDELESVLVQKATGLNDVKAEFAHRRLAQNAILVLIPPKTVDHAAVFGYYESHLEEFTRRETVKWQTIQTRFANQASRSFGQRTINEIRRDLDAGVDLGELIKSFESSFPRSQSDSRVDAVLEDIPIGFWSDALEEDYQFQILRVQERSPKIQIPFVKVEPQIRAKLELEQHRQRHDQYLKLLWADAVLETKHALPVPRTPATPDKK